MDFVVTTFEKNKAKQNKTNIHTQEKNKQTNKTKTENW